MNLLLMRHAKSSWDDEGLGDHERPLNHRGRDAAPKMAQVLFEHNLVPDLVLVSSAVRTRETVDRMLPILGAVEVLVLPELYHAMPIAILKVLDEHARSADTVMVVGHNPGMETMVSNVAGNIVPFPTGAIAHIVMKPHHASQIVAVWRPKELPAE